MAGHIIHDIVYVLRSYTFLMLKGCNEFSNVWTLGSVYCNLVE